LWDEWMTECQDRMFAHKKPQPMSDIYTLILLNIQSRKVEMP
jgi:hypothetical protein